MTPFQAITDEVAAEAVAALLEHGSGNKAASALGIARSTFQNRLLRAAQRGLDGSVPKKIPPGQRVKGVSTLYNSATGEPIIQWVKTKDDGQDPAAIIEILRDGFADFKPAPPVITDKVYSENRMTLFPLSDLHLGLYAWKEETGENWDLNKAEEAIQTAVAQLIASTPETGLAVVLGGGDAMHSDTSDNRTAKSGNALDVDGRYPKVLLATCRLFVRVTEMALQKHAKVIVRVLKGNHDEHSAIAISYFLLAWFRNEPRVTVDADPSLYWWYRFGRVLLGSTHGHTIKPDQMASIMAHRRASDWGATVHRYCHLFHRHHSAKLATEGGGVITETHQAPVPQDAWHYGAGFLSGRSLSAIIYDMERGEVARNRVAL